MPHRPQLLPDEFVAGTDQCDIWEVDKDPRVLVEGHEVRGWRWGLRGPRKRSRWPQHYQTQGSSPSCCAVDQIVVEAKFLSLGVCGGVSWMEQVQAKDLCSGQILCFYLSKRMVLKKASCALAWASRWLVTWLAKTA